MILNYIFMIIKISHKNFIAIETDIHRRKNKHPYSMGTCWGELSPGGEGEGHDDEKEVTVYSSTSQGREMEEAK